MERKVELLAPAGSIESFYAAVNSGADSVYLGGKNFNARYNSQNFNDEEMKHIIQYAHNKNVKVYVTLNIILKDSEIAKVLNYAVYLYENDVDAVIVQDLGLLYLINKHIPHLPVNISTQSVVYDEFGVKFFEKYNVDKVIMARELSLKQLKEIAKNTDASLEVFIHGALCACYSGQCYMSSFLGGRSGNRGKCAQPCRLNYSFYDKENKTIESDYEAIPVLSMKDFIGGETVVELIEAGITTFKIEGRMKGPEYTSSVVEYYRKIIDNCISGDKIKKDEVIELEKRAISTFSRGYTNGYLMPSIKDDMFARTSSGIKGDNIDIIVDEVKDKTKEFSFYRRRKIDFKINLKIGERAILTAYDDSNTVTVYSEDVCELSLKNPATDILIREQLGKLGNTIYNLGNIEIVKDDNVFIKKSTLNHMRRESTEELYSKKAVVYNRQLMGEISNEDIFDFNKNIRKKKPTISLKINSNEEFHIIDKIKMKRVYFPYDLDLDAIKKLDGIEKYLWIPNIVSKNQYNIFKEKINYYEEIFDGVCVNNIGSLYFFKEYSNLKIHCGSFFNIINSFSAQLIKEIGIESFSYSFEANIKDIGSIKNNIDIESEIVVYAYVQLMVMKNCPMSIVRNCKNSEDCNTCNYNTKYALKDRKGVYFNIERKNRLTNIYNSVPLTLIDKTYDFVRMGIKYFYVDTKWEDNIEDIIDALYCEINGIQTEKVLNENKFTRGHYLKNIL
ncbi:U32 family peptidase [Sedimentibacter sp. MB31-C6]|uniref:U32 family peptidase n=1 Tax=Sedimentibacter sp. MB31-C6 TaxID=3109366 RepID=UPI002DDCA792|nr:U32 family peptidase [Sedimentibacter sp. MB36-C1]WSI03923.1 U32 family peptidase [Sedimentibacter sp. MB36-C1]